MATFDPSRITRFTEPVLDAAGKTGKVLNEFRKTFIVSTPHLRDESGAKISSNLQTAVKYGYWTCAIAVPGFLPMSAAFRVFKRTGDEFLKTTANPTSGANSTTPDNKKVPSLVSSVKPDQTTHSFDTDSTASFEESETSTKSDSEQNSIQDLQSHQAPDNQTDLSAEEIAVREKEENIKKNITALGKIAKDAVFFNKIRDALASFPNNKERDDVVQILSNLGERGSFYSREIPEMLHCIREIAQDGSLPESVQHFLDKVDSSCLYDSMQLLAQIPPDQMEAFVTLAIKLTEEKPITYTELAAIGHLDKLPPDQREAFVAHAIKFTEGVQGRDRLSAIECLAKVPPDQRETFIDIALNRLQDVDVEDKQAITTALSEVSPSEWDDLIERIPDVFGQQMEDVDIDDKKNILKSLAGIPRDERNDCLDFLADHYSLLSDIFYSDSVMVFYLLPEDLKSAEGLTKISERVEEAERGSGLEDPTTRDAIMKSCEEKLADLQSLPNLTLPKQTLIAVARFVMGNKDELNLSDTDALVLQASKVIYTLDVPDNEDPAFIHGKLQELDRTPLENFESPTVQLRDGVSFSINISSLAAPRKITSADLPPNATKENFDNLWHAFSKKVEGSENRRELYALLKEIDPESNPEILWKTIEETMNDPGRYLINLLESKDPEPSTTEANWKKVFSSILNRSDAVEAGKFFSEKEEAFLRVMPLIKKCDKGKAQGVDAAYLYLVRPEEKYQFRVEAPVTDTEKKVGIDYLKNWLGSRDPESNLLHSELPYEKQVEKLMTYAKKLHHNESYGMVQEGPERLLPLFTEPKERFFDEDDFSVNDLGAKEALRILNRELEKEQILSFVNEVVRGYIEKQFAGDNAIFQELTGQEIVQEPPHQRNYVRNLIGKFVGASSKVEFDEHANIVADKLRDRPREEVLEIFLKHATPEAVPELVREVNKKIAESNTSREMYMANLPNPEFWDGTGDSAKLNQLGALELLKNAGLINVK